MVAQAVRGDGYRDNDGTQLGFKGRKLKTK